MGNNHTRKVEDIHMPGSIHHSTPLSLVPRRGEEVADKVPQDGEGMAHCVEAGEVTDALVDEVGVLEDEGGGELEGEDGVADARQLERARSRPMCEAGWDLELALEVVAVAAVEVEVVLELLPWMSALKEREALVGELFPVLVVAHELQMLTMVQVPEQT